MVEHWVPGNQLINGYTKSSKLVGINLDDQLKWNEHANKVRSKLATTANAIARIKNTIPNQIKLQTYNSLFKCHLEYCLPIWGGCSNSSNRSIMKIQKKALVVSCGNTI